MAEDTMVVVGVAATAGAGKIGLHEIDPAHPENAFGEHAVVVYAPHEGEEAVPVEVAPTAYALFRLREGFIKEVPRGALGDYQAKQKALKDAAETGDAPKVSGSTVSSGGPKPLHQMTVAEIRAEAVRQDIDLPTDATRPELMAALKAEMAAREERGGEDDQDSDNEE